MPLHRFGGVLVLFGPNARSCPAPGLPATERGGDEVGDPNGLGEGSSHGRQADGLRRLPGGDAGGVHVQGSVRGTHRERLLPCRHRRAVLPVRESLLQRAHHGLGVRGPSGHRDHGKIGLLRERADVHHVEPADCDSVHEDQLQALLVPRAVHHPRNHGQGIRPVDGHLAVHHPLEVARGPDDGADDRSPLVFEGEGGGGDPEEARVGLHRSLREPVTWFTRWSGAGPTPTQVTVPAGTSVRPASWITSAGSPRDRAFAATSWRCRSSSTVTTTLRCPSAIHARYHFSCFARAEIAQLTAAWPTWTASFPLESPRSSRTATTSLYSISRPPRRVPLQGPGAGRPRPGGVPGRPHASPGSGPSGPPPRSGCGGRIRGAPAGARRAAPRGRGTSRGRARRVRRPRGGPGAPSGAGGRGRGGGMRATGRRLGTNRGQRRGAVSAAARPKGFPVWTPPTPVPGPPGTRSGPTRGAR